MYHRGWGFKDSFTPSEQLCQEHYKQNPTILLTSSSSYIIDIIQILSFGPTCRATEVPKYTTCVSRSECNEPSTNPDLNNPIGLYPHDELYPFFISSQAKQSKAKQYLDTGKWGKIPISLKKHGSWFCFCFYGKNTIGKTQSALPVISEFRP